MFSILLIISLIFETLVQPTTVAAVGFQNAGNTEGGSCLFKMSLKSIANSATLDDDDDDDDSKNTHKNTEGFAILHPTTVGRANGIFLLTGNEAMGYAQSGHTFVKRRLFILFHDLKIF